ncbi:hypothetical protein ACLOJK_011851 [Asimina triloba]
MDLELETQYPTYLSCNSKKTCDSRLHAVEKTSYGLPEDEAVALDSLSAIDMDNDQLKEAIISHFMKKYGKLPEEDLLGLKRQLLQEFSPDDTFPLGAPLFMETPHPCSPLAQEFPSFDEVLISYCVRYVIKSFKHIDTIMPKGSLSDDDTFAETSGNQSDRKTSLSTNTYDVLSVNQLLESVLETARQVASVPVSTAPITYDQMKNQCEALVIGKQQKMSVLKSLKQQQDPIHVVSPERNARTDSHSVTESKQSSDPIIDLMDPFLAGIPNSA